MATCSAGSIEESGFSVTSDELLAEEPAALRDAVARLAGDADVIIVTGGTGIASARSHARCRRRAVRPPLPGFGELFRMLSFQEIGPAAMLSRADAGVVGGALVFLLPGSPAAVESGGAPADRPGAHPRGRPAPPRQQRIMHHER